MKIITQKYLLFTGIVFVTTMAFHFMLLLIVATCNSKPDVPAVVIGDMTFMFLSAILFGAMIDLNKH